MAVPGGVTPRKCGGHEDPRPAGGGLCEGGPGLGSSPGPGVGARSPFTRVGRAATGGGLVSGSRTRVPQAGGSQMGVPGQSETEGDSGGRSSVSPRPSRPPRGAAGSRSPGPAPAPRGRCSGGRCGRSGRRAGGGSVRPADGPGPPAAPAPAPAHRGRVDDVHERVPVCVLGLGAEHHRVHRRQLPEGVTSGPRAPRSAANTPRGPRAPHTPQTDPTSLNSPKHTPKHP